MCMAWEKVTLRVLRRSCDELEIAGSILKRMRTKSPFKAEAVNARSYRAEISDWQRWEIAGVTRR